MGKLTEKKKALEDHLIEKIEKSGYPLEIEISGLLDKEYVVFNTQYYFDEKTKQGRAIDIHAMPFGSSRMKKLDKAIAPFRLRTEIVAECKKSETHAWVFFTRPHIPVSGHHISGQYKTDVPEPRSFSVDSFSWLFQKCLTLHYYDFKRIAIAYDEIKTEKMKKENITRKEKNGSSRREIFTAVSQLVKFTCYELHQILSRISKLPKPPSDRELITIFFPTLVFNGDMFEVTLESGKPKVKRKNHILLATHFRCPHCQKVESFIIDVVHFSYFSEFMKILEADFYKIRKNVLEKHDKLIKKAKETRIKCVEESARFSVEE